MNRCTAIALQVLGYECLVAMITTIRIENSIVFDVSFPVRAGLGAIGVMLVLTGALGSRRPECDDMKSTTVHTECRLHE